MDPIIARVGMPVPVDKLFDFAVPEGLRSKLRVGQRVRVRFAGRSATGIVVEFATESLFEGQLTAIEAISDGPILAGGTLETCRGVAEESYAPLGLCINRILPGAMARSSHLGFGWEGSLDDAERWLDERSTRAPRQADVVRLLLRAGGTVHDAALRAALGPSGIAAAKRLVAEQGVPVRRIESQSLPQADEDPALATQHPPYVPTTAQRIVAPADRWQIYYKMVDEVLEQGGAALILAPTVLQIEQLAEIWRRRERVRELDEIRRLDASDPKPRAHPCSGVLADPRQAVGIYHSDLGEGVRGKIWEQARLGRIRVLFGTRSALFVPLAGCRLVILEDEHDAGYKQEEQLPYYDVRNVARTSVASMGARLVLASATPSVEAVWAVRQGCEQLVVSSRDDSQTHEDISTTVVPVGYGNDVLDPAVVEAIHQVVAAGDRAMIVASRLGSFRCVICRECGRTIRCPNCGGNLAYDDRSVQLHCRICGHVARQPRCGGCGSTDLRFVGVGTAAVEAAARDVFPEELVVRLDASTLRTAGARKRAQAILWGEEDKRRFRILVVSPMAAVGPRLDGVKGAVVVGIDAILALPNFRASEQAFQLLAGVRGRMESGMMYIQTRFPEHEALTAFDAGANERFIEQELAHRQAMFYPPFSCLAQLRIPRMGRDTSACVAQIEKALRRLPVAVLGPTPTPAGSTGTVALLLKAKDRSKLRTACDAVHALDVRVEINLDPVWF